MRSRRAARWLVRTVVLSVVSACGSVLPSTSPALPSASSQPGGSVPPTTAATPAAPSPGLPVFADGEPLLLFALRTNLGGGVFVMAPDGSARRRLGTDLPPGIYKAPDWSPDGKHVVFVEEQAGALFIAHLDGSPTEKLEACEDGYCDNPAWSPDGSRLAFTRLDLRDGIEGPAASQIEVLTLATGVGLAAIRLERPLLADVPRWSPDGTELVVQVDRMDDEASETGAAIAIVAAAGGGEPRYLTEFESFAGSPDWGWVSNEIVYAVDLQGLQRTPPGEDVTYDLFGIRPDGTGARAITDLPTGGRLHSPRWTPDGRAIVAKQFDHGSGGGRLVDPVAGGVTPFVTGLDEARPLLRPGTAPAAGADGWIVYQTDTQPTELRLVRPDGTGDHAIEGLPPGAAHPDWSPDGTRIVFTVDEDDSRDIWIANADGSDAHRVVDCEAPCVDADGPAFSPDGGRIAYRVFEQVDGAFPGSRIEIQDLAFHGTRVASRTVAPEFFANGTGVRWSPDGRSLVVDVSTIEAPGTDAERVVSTTIAIIRLHDGESTPLPIVRSETFPSYPDWGPSGDVVTFMAHADGDPEGPIDLFLVGADGSGLRQLTRVGTGDSAWGPTFTPDGRAVLVTVLGDRWTLGSVDLVSGVVTPIPGPIAGAHPRQQPSAVP